MNKLICALLVIGLTGCGTLIPKKVEFGQDKVQEFPDRTARDNEIQRGTADQLDQVARALERVVLTTPDVPSNVVEQVSEVVTLTDALSDSLGPPVERPEYPADMQAARLNTATAKFIGRVTEFADVNDENAGKKIEGTGKIQVPYFVYIFGLFVVGMLAFTFYKIAAPILKGLNPGVGVGLNVVEMGASSMARGFSQLVRGGKKFTKSLSGIVDDPILREKIEAQFKASHKEEHDETTKAAVKHLIKD